MKIATLPFLFVCALVSIGEAALKSYPIFFATFIFVFLYSRLKLKKNLAKAAMSFVSVAVLFAILNIEKSFDATALTKLLINFSFFVFAASYISQLPFFKAINLMKIAAIVFLSFSFIQAFWLVYANHLWLLPFSLENSDSSYAIQKGFILFGDLNKNIWAAKISIFLTILCFCQYVDKRPRAYFYVFLAIGLISLLYVSSRTAQIAFLAFVASLLFFHFWVLKKKRIIMILLSLILTPLFLFLFQLVFRLDFTVLSNFRPEDGQNMGDGFLSRIIIWSYVLKSVTLSDLLYGNGILSFSYYTGGIFTENNPHNIILSIALDFGLTALLLYFFLLYRIFPNGNILWVFLATFLVYANTQYLGYDSDLMVFFIFAYLIRTKSSHIMNKS